MPVVEPEGHLVKIGAHVLGRELVIGADNRPLQQAPDAFDGVGVNIGLYPLLRAVVDRPMVGVPVANARTLEPRLAGR